MGGGGYGRYFPFGIWFEDFRALGFLRPPGDWLMTNSPRNPGTPVLLWKIFNWMGPYVGPWGSARS